MYRIVTLLLSIFFVISCTKKLIINSYDSKLSQFREQYKHGFLDDPRSPLLKSELNELDFFDPDSTWNLLCTCIKISDAIPFEMSTYSGAKRTYIKHSLAKCKIKEKSFEVYIYKNIHAPINPIYKNHLFLPFKDLSNNITTYGGGRYINLYETDISNGKLNIDFNKCYNPWCAYSDGYNCPIPPIENHLNLNIEVGEKNYKGQIKNK